MKQEVRNALMVTLGGILLGFISAYGMITVGHFVILSMGAVVGALTFLSGLFEVLSLSKNKD